MPFIDANPFASLSLIAAPAVLTNASSVLVLSTSNRLARAVDRARALSAELEAQGELTPLLPMRLGQLMRLESRALLLLTGLRLFYLSLGAFAGASLSSLLGATFAAVEHGLLYTTTVVVAALAGVLGVSGLVIGCVVLVRETRLAVLGVTQEVESLREQFGSHLKR